MSSSGDVKDKEWERLEQESDLIDADFGGNKSFPKETMAAIRKLFGNTSRELVKILKEAVATKGVKVDAELAKESVRGLRKLKDTACSSILISLVQVKA